MAEETAVLGGMFFGKGGNSFGNMTIGTEFFSCLFLHSEETVMIIIMRQGSSSFIRCFKEKNQYCH